MSAFVLVPGAWHGGWCFRHVADRLRASGHAVFPLTLTGLGEHAHLAHRGINLDAHIADVVGLLDAEELRDVILFGHSYGGCVISGAAQLKPDALRALVYLDAIVPRDGETLFDHLDDAFKANVIAGADARGEGYLVPTPTMEFLGMGPDHADWVMRRLSPHPLGTATQAVRLGPAAPGIARIYIDCDTPSITPTHQSKARVRSEPGWAVHTLHTAHDAFIAEPDALAALLDRVAASLN